MTSFYATLALCAWMGWGLTGSPLPLAVLAVLLLGDNPGKKAMSFTLAWFLSMVAGLAVCIPLVHWLMGFQLPKLSSHKEQVGWAAITLGSLMILGALVLMLRARSKPEQESSYAKRMLDRATGASVRDVFVLGLIFGVLNVTNIPYWLGTAIFLERSDDTDPQKVFTALMVAVIASASFLLVTAVAFLFRDWVTPRLTKARGWVVTHSGSIAPGLLALSGVLALYVGLTDIGAI